MSYPINLTSVLTGATLSQLRGWRRKGLLHPEVNPARPPLYSFRDLVALRSLVFLRKNASLQKISRAFQTLDVLRLTEHPSEYKFGTDGRTIFVGTKDDEVFDLVKNPGQMDLFTFEEISRSFTNWKGQEVVDFNRPSRFVEVNVLRMGGWPTVAGTRIPYNLIADLVDHETVYPDDVSHFYPSVSMEAAADVDAFDRKVKAVGEA